MDEYRRARNWCRDKLSFDKDAEFNTFEVGHHSRRSCHWLSFTETASVDHHSDPRRPLVRSSSHFVPCRPDNPSRWTAVSELSGGPGRPSSRSIRNALRYPSVKYQSCTAERYPGYGQSGCRQPERSCKFATRDEVPKPLDGRLHLLEESGEGESPARTRRTCLLNKRWG